jgi:hypothetical protein
MSTPFYKVGGQDYGLCLKVKKALIFKIFDGFL